MGRIVILATFAEIFCCVIIALISYVVITQAHRRSSEATAKGPNNREQDMSARKKVTVTGKGKPTGRSQEGALALFAKIADESDPELASMGICDLVTRNINYHLNVLPKYICRWNFQVS